MIAAVARTLTEHNIPPLDAGLKSIFVQQVRNLLKGGWPVDEIRRNAIVLAMKYDRFAGHRAMTGLQGILERADEDRQAAAHNQAKDECELAASEAALNLREQGIVVPGTERLLARRSDAARRARHPNFHAFVADPKDRSSCSICTGPVGIHVRPLVVGAP